MAQERHRVVRASSALNFDTLRYDADAEPLADSHCRPLDDRSGPIGDIVDEGTTIFRVASTTS